MTSQEFCPYVQEFCHWREQLYNALGSRRESVMELLDSLASNLQASSVVELSLNPLFRRNYNSLYKGIQDFLPSHWTLDKKSNICVNITQIYSRLDFVQLV